MKTYLSGERGRLTALSKAIGAHAPDVSRWADGKRPVPIQFGLPIEQATNGEVTRLDMYPIEVIEKVWPELLKRKRARTSKIDNAASSDDVQNNAGGSSDRKIKEMRVGV
ncbi:DNA-binding transcriptional regulator YdaS (Cro superfamily) [Paraburkholderia sp. JPY681]|nr:DNA-binding transcriptional regulator YdaS (Cro superfamily) [Paraburkholderia atlantica]